MPAEPRGSAGTSGDPNETESSIHDRERALAAVDRLRRAPSVGAGDADWAFASCLSLTGRTPCYDVYTHNGAYWMCASCGTTKEPNENTCRQLTAYQLANGRWCS